MARIETDPNYTSPTFSRATAGTDIFKKEDVQQLAAALSTHDHTSGKGLALTAGSIPNGTITSAMIADGTIQGTDIAVNTIDTSRIQDNSITTSKIADGTINIGDLNAVIGNFGAAITWSPITTQGGSTPTATITCNRYIKIGRLVFIAAMLNYTAIGSINQDIIVGNLPAAVAPANVGSYFAVGSFMYARAGVAVYAGSAVLYTATGLKFAAGGSDGTNNLQGYLGNVSGPNFAIASGDFLSFTAMYESAS